MAARNVEKFAPRVRWFTDFTTSTRHSTLVNSPASFSATNSSTPFPSTASAGTRKKKKWFEWGVAARGRKICLGANSESRQFRIQNGSAIFHRIFHLRFGRSARRLHHRNFAPPPKTGGARPPDILQRGKLVTIDYGFTADEMFSPAPHQRHAARLFPSSRQPTICWPIPANRI